MTEHAEVTTVLYSDLTEDEEAILREFEREVLGTSVDRKVYSRPPGRNTAVTGGRRRSIA